jgi:hypothetical protein
MADNSIPYDLNTSMGALTGKIVSDWVSLMSDVDRVVEVMNNITTDGVDKNALSAHTAFGETAPLALTAGNSTVFYDLLVQMQTELAIPDVSKIDRGV